MLKYLRRRARLTQRELSIVVGYSEGQISRLEKNERIVDAATLQALFVPALGIDGQPEEIGQLLELAASARTRAEKKVIAADTAPISRQPSSKPLTNLPTRLTSFVGREAAIESLRQLIPATRLLTLTGVGGVGKTSLALVVGSGLLSTFSDGVWWVELASLMDGNLAPQLIAAIFKLPESHRRTYLEGLAAYFQDRHLLLILDNCEHLIDSCATVVDYLLRTCPQLHILTTSREALRVQGEVEWPVLPLATPRQVAGLDTLSTATMMQSYEAVRLFVERARVTQPTFAWADQNAAPVALICRQLDGIPLAIELAASRLKGMSIDELAARLDHRFHLLTGGSRTALPRHQTLRATLDWSYYLLSEEERALLCRLSVFSGGWTLDAVEAIAERQEDGLVPIPNPIELLLQLVNRSLVVAETDRRQTRYRLLETIREYATEKLQEIGEVEALRARHFTYYLRLAEQSKDLTLTGQRIAAWADRMALEMDNLRRAFVWGEEQEDNAEQSLRLAGALWLFWYNFGNYHEGQAWLNNALARATGSPPETRATALYGLAYLLALNTTPMYRTALVEEALFLSEQVNYDLGIAHCNSLLGEIAVSQGNYLRALERYQRALDRFRALDCPFFFSAGLYDLAYVWLQLGQVDKAIPLLEQSFARTREEGYLFLAGIACYAFTGLLRVDERQGKSLFEQELARRRVLGAPEMLAPLLHAYGRELLFNDDEQDLHDSLQILTECLTLWQRLDIQVSRAGGTARASMDLGHIYTLQGEYTLAVEFEEEALRLYKEAGDLHGVAWAHMSIGWPALAQGDLALAQASFQDSLKLSPDGSMNSVPYALIGLAETRRRQGKLASAGQLFGAAMRFDEQATATYAPLKKFAAMQAARSHLNNPDFAAAWAAGETETIEQAIDHALQ
jgi:predicted ATPase/transcriptional regulator with XRE-family HTH domain